MKPIEITAANLDATLDKEGIVLIDFWAGWCAPCRAFAPVFEAAAEAHPDVTFGKVDTEAEQGIAQEFEIRSIPTVAAFRDGIGIYMQPGALQRDQLEQLIHHVRSLDMAEVKRKMEEEMPPEEGE